MPLGRVLLYVASLGALALVGRSIVMGPLPLWLAGAALTLYVAIVLCGVFFLRLQMFVDSLNEGPPEARGVALTFDDGPSPTSTPKILDLLDEANVKATFFVIGKKAEAHPDLVREIKKRGHVIAMHSYGHHRFFSLKGAKYVREDLVRAMGVLRTITGENVTLFRPPIGHTNPTIARIVKELGLTVVGWNVRGLDGLRVSDPKKVSARVKRGLKDGAVILLHDAAEREDREPASIAALPEILRAMSGKNLTGVRVDEWTEPNP